MAEANPKTGFIGWTENPRRAKRMLVDRRSEAFFQGRGFEVVHHYPRVYATGGVW